MTPNAECLVYCEKFLVVYVIVEFWRSKDMKVKSDWVKFKIRGEYKEDCLKGIVESIRFNDNLKVRQPMGKNRSASKSLLESIKYFLIFFKKVLRNTLSSKSGE